MLLRVSTIIIVAFFGYMSISNLLSESFFYFFVWLFIGVFFLIATYPFLAEMDEKTIPVFQIFASLFALILFASSIAIFDFAKVGFSILESLLYGIAIGILLVGFMMILRGNN